MAEAKQPGGLYYIGETAVDANGCAIEGAPKKPKDTPREQQPGALGAPTPEEKLAVAIASAITGKGAKGTSTKESSDEEDSGELPTVDELDAHLAGITSLDEVKAMKRRDKRVTAAPKYEARIAELKGE